MDEEEFYWCVRHNRVETSGDVCPARYTMGPYWSRAEAEQAVERVRQREAELAADDARWEGD